MGLLALALVLVTAEPEPMAVELSWTAPTGCPDGVSAAEDLAQLTRGALVHQPGAAVHVDVVVIARAPGFELGLDISTATLDEHRTLDGSSCETLARAATLMIAVAVAPVASAQELPVVTFEVPPPLEPSPHTVEQLSRERAAVTPPRRRARDRVYIGAWTGPSFGTGPRVTAIIGGDLTWRRGTFGLQLSGWHAFRSERPIEDGIGVRASTSGGGARFVYAMPVRAIELPVSLGVELGALAGSGSGMRVNGRPTLSLWVAAVLGVGLAWPARSRIALAVRTDVLLALRAPGIHLERRDGTRQPVFVTPPVGVRLLAGPLLRLP